MTRYLFAVMGRTKHVAESSEPDPRGRRERSLCGQWGEPETWWTRPTAYMTAVQLAKVLGRPLCKSCARSVRLIDGDPS